LGGPTEIRNRKKERGRFSRGRHDRISAWRRSGEPSAKTCAMVNASRGTRRQVVRLRGKKCGPVRLTGIWGANEGSLLSKVRVGETGEKGGETELA